MYKINSNITNKSVKLSFNEINPISSITILFFIKTNNWLHGFINMEFGFDNIAKCHMF